MSSGNQLERLINLASETSSERRRELLREISDLFLSAPDDYTDRENTYFGEIMGAIAYEVEQKFRVELAEKLAAEASAPGALIRRLASDDIEVARPVLEQSPVLDENDLLDVAERHGQDHLLAITRRSDITQAVSRVLVERGDDQVVGGLIENETAQIAPETMAEVVDRAKSNTALHASLADRADLPMELMDDLVQYVSQELRQRILSESSIDSKQLDEALKGTEEKVKQQAADFTQGMSRPEALIEKLAAEKKLNEKVLVKFVRSQQVTEFICGLAKLADIDIPTAKHAIFNEGHEGLAIICRAMNFDRSTFSIFVLATGSNKTRAIEETYSILQNYDRLTPETAQRILRFWRVRKLASSPEPAASATPPANDELQATA